VEDKKEIIVSNKVRLACGSCTFHTTLITNSKGEMQLHRERGEKFREDIHKARELLLERGLVVFHHDHIAEDGIHMLVRKLTSNSEKNRFVYYRNILLSDECCRTEAEERLDKFARHNFIGLGIMQMEIQYLRHAAQKFFILNPGKFTKKEK
jgi:hypothetical protein